MPDRIKLVLQNSDNIYIELTQILSQYKEEPQGSKLFIVESDSENPIVGIKYPGKKVRKRPVAHPRANSALWANLYDFEVVAFHNNEVLDGNQFTFSALMEDFYQYKKDNKEFWQCIEKVYFKNQIATQPPLLNGINARLFLSVLKWIWIQEDFNYHFNWEEVCSPVRYVLETRTGSRTSKGAGRAKFFAGLILLKYFDIATVKKIIPLY